MSSKKVEPASPPVFHDSLRYHLKPRPVEPDLKEIRKDRRSREKPRRSSRLGGDGGKPGRDVAAGAGADPKVQPKPEPVAGWITRAEARSLLGIDEKELAELLKRFRLRPSWVDVYSKPEILALRDRGQASVIRKKATRALAEPLPPRKVSRLCIAPADARRRQRALSSRPGATARAGNTRGFSRARQGSRIERLT